MEYVSELGRKFGEEHHAAKLSDVDVERMRALSEHGVPYRDLCKIPFSPTAET